jgi:hypothetical protein
LLSEIQSGHKVPETHIHNICIWMFDELKPREELPESHHVKRVATELWKEHDLRIFFFKNPKRWADYPSVNSLAHSLRKFSFGVELRNRLAKLGINPTIHKMGSSLEVCLGQDETKISDTKTKRALGLVQIVLAC